MTKNEFVKIARDFGYSDDVIADLVELQAETGLEFDEIAIEEHLVD